MENMYISMYLNMIYHTLNYWGSKFSFFRPLDFFRMFFAILKSSDHLRTHGLWPAGGSPWARKAGWQRFWVGNPPVSNGQPLELGKWREWCEPYPAWCFFFSQMRWLRAAFWDVENHLIAGSKEWWSVGFSWVISRGAIFNWNPGQISTSFAGDVL